MDEHTLVDLDPAMRDRFNRLYDALVAIENACELASEDAWGGYLSGIHETASVVLEAERKALAGAKERAARCGLCGSDPALGFAKVGDFRFCHGDDQTSPTCYMIASSRTSLHDHQALVAGDMSVEEYVRRLKVRVNARMSEGAPW